jgi:hypothetical protein
MGYGQAQAGVMGDSTGSVIVKSASELAAEPDQGMGNGHS